MIRLFFCVLFLTSISSANAANVFVRQGATGDGSGADWTNAKTNIPSSSDLVRGNVYYIADGNYTFPSPLSTSVDGTRAIEFRKCSSADGVSNSVEGYQSAYCDGQASFNEVRLASSYWIFNGAYRNQSNWSQGSAYGFQIDGFETRSDFSNVDRVADEVTIKFVDIGPDDGNANLASYSGAVIYAGGFDRVAESWTVQRNYIHNGRVMGQLAYVRDFLFEYNYIAKSWEKSGFRGQGRAASVVFRYNILRDVCQGNGFDPSSGFMNCTAIIGWYGNAGSNNEDYSNSAVYGNVVIDTVGIHYSDAVIFMGDDRTSQGGGAQNCSGCRIFNNTFVGMSQGAVGFKFTGIKTGTEARNNIWFDVGTNTPFCQASQCSNNVKVTSSSTFVNAFNEDYRLASDGAAGNGTGLSAPYDLDMNNIQRGTGIWDLGAFEFAGEISGGPVSRPLAPTALLAN